MASTIESGAAPGQAASIQFELKPVEGFNQTAHVRIAPEHVEKRREKTARELAAKLRLPGFRKGKVPVQIVRSRFAADVEQETLESLIPEAYRTILDDNEALHPIDTPRVENLQMDQGAPLSFDLVFEVRPELTLGELGRIQVERRRARVSDARVEQALAELVERNATWEPVERGAKPGDALRISYVPLKADGTADEPNRNESYSLELGAEGVLPEFNAALEGLEVGDDTQVEVSYAADYPREDLRGKTMSFDVKVLELREKRVPALDDAFVNERTDADSLDTLRQRMRTELEKAAEEESLRQLDNAILDAILAGQTVPSPPSLESRYLASFAEDYEQMTGRKLTPEERSAFDNQLRERARRNAQRAVVFDNVRRANDIRASDEDVAARLAELAAERGMEVAAFERAVRAASNMDRLRGDLEERKVLEYLRSVVKTTLVEFDPGPSGDTAQAEG